MKDYDHHPSPRLRKGEQKMKEYDHKKIEAKWQKIWEKSKIFEAVDDSPSSRAKLATGRLKRKKFYALIEFPYPSGEGLHVGHIRSNTAMDVISRKRRMEGFNVLYPIGWDAFGLPTENYAIKTGIHPITVTKQNTDTFRRQLKELGFSFDWSREINTTDPRYYKWTQWIFLQFLKRGLAYKKKMPINWCPKDKIGLANEEVVTRSTGGGAVAVCERCGTPVEKRDKEQWMLAITKYADRLDRDLVSVDYQEKIKIQQRNWIGKSEGAQIKFKVESGKLKVGEVEVFTTRPDTLFGATYLVLAPEHSFVQKSKDKISNWDEILRYIVVAKKKTEMERTSEDKEKTGVELKGVKAINPANGEEIPIWIADYVLADYGTGAIMAVPAHDGRDFQFAKKYTLPIREVVIPYKKDNPRPDKKTEKREVVTAIVKNPKDGTYLCLRWKTTNWQSFPTGGIDGDDLVTAAKREVREETGYKNLKFIKQIVGSVYAEFYRPHKDSNVFANFKYLVFELENEEKDEVSEKEKKNHEVVWVKESEIESFINVWNQKIAWKKYKDGDSAYIENGIMANSVKFDGMDSEEAKWKITEAVGGKRITKFKLRDWVFSRQHYWGEPIPVVFCPACAKASAGKDNSGWVPVPEKDLPVELPRVEKYLPTDTGESPLAAIKSFVETRCPQCGGPARRETDTMPNWAGSSWYYLRYIDPHNKKEFVGKEKLKYWSGITSFLNAKRSTLNAGPVDWYNGGMEHTTLHLLYSRFWHKFLFDIGVVPTSEPYAKRTSHGLILAEGGLKMSKSRPETIINPDDLVERFGADSLRLYEMFMGPFDQSVAWSVDGIVGTRRFLEKVWRTGQKLEIRNPKSETPQERILPTGQANSKSEIQNSKLNAKRFTLDAIVHRTIKKVGEDIEAMRFNTAISSLMICANEMDSSENVPKELFEMFLKILSPFAPHIAEELWLQLGNKSLIAAENWPVFDPAKIADEVVTIVVQVNGKVRAQFSAAPDIAEAEAVEKAKSLPEVQKWLADKPLKKAIYVKGRLVNLVL